LVQDDVLQVLQCGYSAEPAGAPTGIGIQQVQQHLALATLAAPHLLVLNAVGVIGCFLDQEQRFILVGLLFEPVHGLPAGRQPAAANVALTKLVSTYIPGVINWVASRPTDQVPFQFTGPAQTEGCQRLRRD
jgi:hypothetical protein